MIAARRGECEMDAETADHQLPKGKMPGEGTSVTGDIALIVETLRGKMPGEGTPTTAVEAPSGKGKMPGEGTSVTGDIALIVETLRGKMPGEGTPTTAVEAPSGKGKMPGEGTSVTGDIALIVETLRGKMPGEGTPRAAAEAPSGKGKMPGGGMLGAAVEAEIPVEQYSIFAKAGAPLPAAALAALGPYTQRGSTANFDVYYDNSLGTNGQSLADAVLANCEWDLTQLRGWFG